MKKIVSFMLAMLLIASFGVFALGSGDSETKTQEAGSTTKETEDNTKLGDYNVEIKSCRLAKDWEGKDVVIVNYGFKNNGDEAAAFYTALTCTVYQNGVGLNTSYTLADSANYSADNQTKEIKPGTTLDVEEAYELNDTTTPIDVEVKEWISFDDTVITKTFEIAE